MAATIDLNRFPDIRVSECAGLAQCRQRVLSGRRDRLQREAGLLPVLQVRAGRGDHHAAAHRVRPGGDGPLRRQRAESLQRHHRGRRLQAAAGRARGRGGTVWTRVARFTESAMVG